MRGLSRKLSLPLPVECAPLSRLHALSELRSFKKPHVKRLSIKTEHLINLVELKHCHLRNKVHITSLTGK